MSETSAHLPPLTFPPLFVEGIEINVVRELNRKKDGGGFHQVLLLENENVGHIPVAGSPHSVLRVAQMREILTSIHHVTFPRVLGPIEDASGNVIGFQRELIPLHDPFWRKVFPGLNIETWLRVGIALAYGLHELHRQGWINCDVKPSNICFRPTPFGPRPVLFDHDITTRNGTVCSNDLGKSVLGTPGYITPEQASGRWVTPATDEHALALLLLSILLKRNGIARRESDTCHKLIRQAARGVYPYWKLAEPLLPRRVLRVLQTAMNRDKEARHGSCRVFGRALLAALHKLTEEERRRPLPGSTGKSKTPPTPPVREPPSLTEPRDEHGNSDSVFLWI